MSALTAVTPKERGNAEPTGVDLRGWHTPELVIALCGPIGSPLHDVAEKLDHLLEQSHGYECRTIRLSKFIDDIQGLPPAGASQFEKIRWRIDKGNALREKFGASVLADLAIREIASQREKSKPEESKEYKPARICHIIDSIKNREELETLRLVYRDLLFTVGVFGSLQAREANLKASRMELSELYQLIDRDSGEEKDFGQTVREIFPRADYFVRVDGDSAAMMDSKLERLLSLLFDLRVTTPTLAETAMYHAAAAARNSACLSRQVGAAIVDDDGRLLSIGWNDVPRFGGGVYRLDGSAGDRENDHRCYNLKSRCESDNERFEIAERTVDALAAELKSQGIAMDAVKKELLVHAVLKSSIGSLLEFSRALHAEMHAHSAPGLPSLRERLRAKLQAAEPLPDDLKEGAVNALERLPDGDRLCHGDFHPENVLLTPGGPIIIDWVDAARGHALADVARSYILIAGGSLPPRKVAAWIDGWGRKRLVNAYLKQYFALRPDDQDRLSRWIPVIAAARLSEGIAEEESTLMAVAREVR